MPKLALFPLNTVLFPGMPISLHIFEERYKLMISRCIAERQPFGVILLQQGSAEQRPGQRVVPYTIGCAAHITQVEPVGLGRLNIVAVGQERFQVQTFDRSAPYLAGEVTYLPFEAGQPNDVRAQARRLRPWLERYLQLIGQAESLDIDVRQLPNDAVTLGYLAASLLKAEMADKQSLLVVDNARDMLAEVVALYRKEVTLFEIMSQQEAPEMNGVFSAN